MSYRKLMFVGAATLLAGVSHIASAQSGQVVSMKEAIATAVNSNPQIAQAQFNKEAIEAERGQAQGLYYPRVSAEASAGIRSLDNTTRRALGIAGNTLYPRGIEGTADWTLIDFGRRHGELLRQSARVDGASLRVVERSEFIALQVSRQYLNLLLQQRILAASEDNVAFHQTMVDNLTTGVQQGSISIADQQQARERLQAAVVTHAEAEQDLEEARITLQNLTGLDVTQVQMPDGYASSLPASIDEAVGYARTNNPLVKEAAADVDAAHAQADSAKADLYPTIGVDAIGRAGSDFDGFQGKTNDIQARVYMRWNIFDGGVNRNKYQEMVRRASESRYRLYELTREAEKDVRTAWNDEQAQQKILAGLDTQSKVSDDLLLSYRAQFNVGRRSLLDVLDAQNSRYNVLVRLETARFSELFAQYQILAATGKFLDALGQAPGAGAGANDRGRFNYGPSLPAELEYRHTPR